MAGLPLAMELSMRGPSFPLRSGNAGLQAV
jgi:hypothetical protein